MYKLMFILTFFLILLNCNDTKKINNNNKFLNKIRSLKTFNDFYFTSDTIFFENDSLIIGDISQLYLTENENYIVTDTKFSRRVFLFDKRGQFVSVIGKNGNGPGEYVTPYYSFESKNFIYIIDDIKQNLIKFDNSGNYISTKNLKIPIRKCYYSNKKDILFIMSPMANNYSIFKYDLKNDELLKIGEIEKDYFGVSMRFLGGGLFLKDTELYAMGVLEPNLYKFTINGKLLKKIKFDKNVFLRPIPSKYKRILIKSHEEVKKLIKQISRVRNIFLIDDELLLIEIEDLYPDHNLKVSYIFSTLDGKVINNIFVENKMPILLIKNNNLVKMYRKNFFTDSEKIGIIKYEF
ncbi:6-bladed beta-propeller [Calditrichota bacterium GD2]